MAPVLVAILSLTVLGIPFVLAVDRSAPPLRLLGLAFLYGTGVIYFVLLALSVLHVRWSLLSVTIAAIVVAVGARCAPPPTAASAAAPCSHSRSSWRRSRPRIFPRRTSG